MNCFSYINKYEYKIKMKKNEEKEVFDFLYVIVFNIYLIWM